MTSSVTRPWEFSSGNDPATHAPCSEQVGCINVADRLTVTEASDLLDWLEGHGISPREVSIDSEGRMSVRWVA
jgi:hypothetical protein